MRICIGNIIAIAGNPQTDPAENFYYLADNDGYLLVDEIPNNTTVIASELRQYMVADS